MPARWLTSPANPLLARWTGPYSGVPAFDQVKVEYFKPALEAAITGDVVMTSVLGVIGATSAPYRLVGPGGESVGEVALSTLFDLALVAVLLLLGETLRSRRVLREEAALRLRLAEQEHRRRLTEGRLRAGSAPWRLSWLSVRDGTERSR